MRPDPFVPRSPPRQSPGRNPGPPRERRGRAPLPQGERGGGVNRFVEPRTVCASVIVTWVTSGPRAGGPTPHVEAAGTERRSERKARLRPASSLEGLFRSTTAVEVDPVP